MALYGERGYGGGRWRCCSGRGGGRAGEVGWTPGRANICFGTLPPHTYALIPVHHPFPQPPSTAATAPRVKGEGRRRAEGLMDPHPHPRSHPRPRSQPPSFTLPSLAKPASHTPIRRMEDWGIQVGPEAVLPVFFAVPEAGAGCSGDGEQRIAAFLDPLLDPAAGLSFRHRRRWHTVFPVFLQPTGPLIIPRRSPAYPAACLPCSSQTTVHWMLSVASFGPARAAPYSRAVAVA